MLRLRIDSDLVVELRVHHLDRILKTLSGTAKMETRSSTYD